MYSGGKDSQASLIWAVEKYGAKNIEAVFCDTNWENPDTYLHIHSTVKDLGVKLTIVKSKKYDGLVDLAIKKKRFPSTKARFCTEELKSKPIIDYVLDEVQDNFISIQGIRADESESRSKMSKECRMFKYYFEPYGYDKKGKPKYHTYRKKDVVAYCEKYADDVWRPVFEWTGKEVIDYIIANGQKPNNLYYQGFKRVGCFPCIMCTHGETKNIMERYPERIEEIIKIEEETGQNFFPPNYIPKRYHTGVNITEEGEKNSFPYMKDIVKYLNDKAATIDMFQEKEPSCMSLYGICE